MNNQEEPQSVPDDVMRRRASHLKYYSKRYHTDMDFRIQETKRNSKLIMDKYNSDPEYKERIKAANLARYHAKKAMLERDKVE